MKKLIILFSVFSLLQLHSLHSQWVRQNYPTQKQVNSIHFIDTLHGWMTAGGNGGFGDSSIIYYTSTGGNNWIKQYVADSTWLVKIRFADLNTGYGVGNTYTFLKTINGGIEWNNIPNPPGAWFDDIAVINKDTIYGCTASSFMDGIYKSTDGGQNFTRTYNTFTTKLFFTDYEHGWAIVGNFYLVRTTDAGQNWATVGMWAGAIRDVFFIDANTGWLTDGSSNNNAIFKTINGGVNWFVIDSFYNGGTYTKYFNNLFFINNNIGWCGGSIRSPNFRSIILKTTNGGANWGYQDISDSSTCNSLFFLDSLHGWAYGILGHGNYTNNSGGPILVLSIRPLGKVVTSYKLYQNFPNPFNPITSFKLLVPARSAGGSSLSNIQITVYDISGKLVKMLINKQLRTGEYLINFDGSNYSSGIYFYSLKVDGILIDTKKMILLK